MAYAESAALYTNCCCFDFAYSSLEGFPRKVSILRSLYTCREIAISFFFPVTTPSFRLIAETKLNGRIPVKKFKSNR